MFYRIAIGVFGFCFGDVLLFTSSLGYLFFFFNDTATTEIYTLSLHDALPISLRPRHPRRADARHGRLPTCDGRAPRPNARPHEAVDAHVRGTARRWRALPRARQIGRAPSELQSLAYLVCRLLLEKKKKQHTHI